MLRSFGWHGAIVLSQNALIYRRGVLLLWCDESDHPIKVRIPGRDQPRFFCSGGKCHATGLRSPPMAMQRQVSPIPPGRYWILLNGPANIADFDDWLRDMAGAARVETSELGRRGSASVGFVIFNVPEGRAPFLNAAQFGFPNFAGPDVHSAQDVISRPDEPPDPLDRIPDPLEFAKEKANQAFLLAAVIVLILALRR